MLGALNGDLSTLPGIDCPSFYSALDLAVVLWLAWSLLVGSLANRLPMRWLCEANDGADAGGRSASPRGYERWRAIRRWKPWIPDAADALLGGIRKASLSSRDPATLQRLIAETRRGELVHWALWPAWLVTGL